MPGEVRGDALGRLAVPQLGNAASLAAGREDFLDQAQDELAVAPDKRVGALLDGDRPLGVLAQVRQGMPRAVVSSCSPPEPLLLRRTCQFMWRKSREVSGQVA